MINDNQLKDLKAKARAVITERRDQYLELLSGILKFPTVSGADNEADIAKFQEATKGILNFVKTECHRQAMVFRDYDGFAAVAEWAGTDADRPPVGVAAHVDVVPADDEWDHPPFAGEIANGEVWGRGTQDNKGPLATALAAIDTLRALGHEPAAGVRILIGTQEETGDWEDVDRLIEAGEAPGPVIVPDGEYPIINGEKGMITLKVLGEWKDDEDSAIRFISLRSGRRANMVPDRAELILTAFNGDEAFDKFDKIAEVMSRKSDDVEIEIESDPDGDAGTRFTIGFSGRAAHGSLPHLGHNAALDALEFLSRLEGLPAPVKCYADFLGERARKLDASGFDLACHHDHLGDTTVNLGILEIDPEDATAYLNIRFPIGLDIPAVHERVGAAVKALDDSSTDLTARMEQDGKAYEPLFVSPEENEAFLSPLKRAYETVTGRECGYAAIAGTTYAKAYPLAVAFGPVDTPGGEEELAHQKNERVTIERYLDNILITVLALAQLTD